MPVNRALYSIYYMRFIAVLLIMNSHFNSKHILGFEPFALYGYLGNLGNMIFFFISSYVLTIGFKKYEHQMLRWVVYRFFYLVFIVLTVLFLFKFIDELVIPNILTMFWDLFNSLNFISDMIYLSLLFPLFYQISRRVRLGCVFLLALFVIFLTGTVDIKLISFFVYAIMFIGGICVANNEIGCVSNNPGFRFCTFICSMLVFLTSKVWSNALLVPIFSKILIVYTFFRLFELIDFTRIPTTVNRCIKLLAELSLFFYLTHFSFINISYQMNRYLALFILIIIILPICYIERKLLNPIVNAFKNRLLASSPIGTVTYESE